MLPVAQVMGCIASVLLYFVVTFTHHQMDTCVTLLAGAAVMLNPFAQCLAMLDHSYYLSFNDFQNLCIQFLFSSMYLSMDIATYLHTFSVSNSFGPSHRVRVRDQTEPSANRMSELKMNPIRQFGYASMVNSESG